MEHGWWGASQRARCQVLSELCKKSAVYLQSSNGIVSRLTKWGVTWLGSGSGTGGAGARGPLRVHAGAVAHVELDRAPGGSTTRRGISKSVGSGALSIEGGIGNTNCGVYVMSNSGIF
jgi:hypothetical protein